MQDDLYGDTESADDVEILKDTGRLQESDRPFESVKQLRDDLETERSKSTDEDILDEDENLIFGEGDEDALREYDDSARLPMDQSRDTNAFSSIDMDRDDDEDPHPLVSSNLGHDDSGPSGDPDAGTSLGGI